MSQVTNKANISYTQYHYVQSYTIVLQKPKQDGAGFLPTASVKLWINGKFLFLIQPPKLHVQLIRHVETDNITTQSVICMLQITI